MAQWKVNSELLPAKLLYFFYFGGIGSLWPFLPLLARLWSIPPLAIGVGICIGALLTIPFLIIAWTFLKTSENQKTALQILICIQILLFGSCAILTQKIQPQGSNSNSNSRHAQLLCSHLSPQLHLQQCTSSDQSCFQKDTMKNYFEDGGDEWLHIKPTKVSKRSTYEYCDAKCVMDTQNMDACDLLSDPKKCSAQEDLIYMENNQTYLKFEMRVEVLKIKRNESCIILPVDSVSFDSKRLWSSCPFSNLNTTASVLDSCSLNCAKNPKLNGLLQGVEEFSLKTEDPGFWIYLFLVGISVFIVIVGTVWVDGFCLEVLGKNGKLLGIQRLFGALGWGIFALISGYLIDYYSEGKVSKEWVPSVVLSCGLLCLSWINLGILTAKPYLYKDTIQSVFSLFITDYKNFLLIFACVLVGFGQGLQFNFILWFMEDLSENTESGFDICEVQKWLKLAQGIVVLLESFLEIPIYIFSGYLLKHVGASYYSTAALAALGLRLIATSIIKNPWLIIPTAAFQGLSNALLFLAILSQVLAPNRKCSNAWNLTPALLFRVIGISIGAVVSAVIIEHKPGPLVFQIFGGILLFSSVLHLISVLILQQNETTLPRSFSGEVEEPESEEMVDEHARKASAAETLKSSSTAEWKEASDTTWIKKFKLLLWKNFKIQTRHKIQTVVEIIIPLVFTFALAMIRVLIPISKVTEPTLFEAFELKGNVPDVLRSLTNEILYTPGNAYIDQIMETVQNEFFESQGLNYSFRSFPTESQMVRAYEQSMAGFAGQTGTTAFNATSNVLAGIVFPKLNKDKLPSSIEYSLRFPAYQRTEFDLFSERFTFKPAWFTESIYPLFRLPGPRSRNPMGGFPGYFAEGFLYLQNAIESSITKSLLNAGQLKEYNDYNIKLQRFPYPTYTNDNFIFASQFWMAYFLTLSFIYPAMNITKMIVHEKECRLKEFMKMMGLPNWLHWTAWFIKTFLYLVVTLVFLTILMKIQFEDDRAILTEANALVLFVVFIFHAISLIGFCFFMSTIYSSANSAATAAGFVWLMFFLPYGFLFPRINTLSRQSKYMTSFLLANSPLTYACYIISTFEGTGAGIQWDKLTEGVTPDDNFCVLDCIVMMIVNALTYMLMAFYIEIVWPGKYGVPLPWYFIFTKWYWTGGVRQEKIKRTPSIKKSQSTFFETDPAHLKVGIDIKGLSKIFGKKAAVNDLNLKLYEDQITALLGHNGAGKTTTMSMLTGILTPTKGTALIYQHDICKDMSAVRASLGMCPQYDVLFDELTVEEHLRFYSMLKGYNKFETEDEVERMLGALGFEAKRHAQAHTLSGGMKRKLSVGIAFCAGSKTVLLDEPTSGMDPGARRSTWDLIQMEKFGRTVILSTHFMEEADLLGDRIAIMAEGSVRCCGSSLFLKKKYGGDYRLVIVKQPDCVVSTVTNVLKTKIPTIQVNEDVGAELSYSLPAENSADFPALFEELENRKDELGFASYGVGNTTIEEVFMRVCEQSITHGCKTSQSMNTLKSNGSTRSHRRRLKESFSKDTLDTERLEKKITLDGPRNKGWQLQKQQMKSMLKKKVLYALRNKSLLLLQVGIPVSLLFVSLLAIKTLPGMQTPDPHLMTMNRYETIGETTTTISCERDMKVCNGYREIMSEKYSVEQIRGDFLSYILDKETEDIAKTSSQHIIGFEQRGKSPRAKPTELTAFFNNQPFHTPPLALNTLSNAILRAFKIPTELTLTNHPFDYNSIDKLKQTASFFTPGFMIGWIINFGLAFQAASFIIFPIHERVTNAKHLQFVAGVKITIYWTAAFLVDILNYMVPCVLMLGVILAMKMDEFYSVDVMVTYLILCVAHAWAMIPMMSLFSFAFTLPSSGYARMTVLHASTGLISMLIVIILDVPEFNIQDLTDTLHNIFLLLPNYALGMGIVQITSHHDLQDFCETFDLKSFCVQSPDFICCVKYQSSFYSWVPFGIGRNILSLVVWGLVSILGIVIVESRIFHKIRAIMQWRNEWEEADNSSISEEENPLDDDVSKEAQRINSQSLSRLAKQDNLILRNLTKVYGNFTAVNHLTLGIRQGETFGLLGVNGAGKTTTFKMLTGDIPVTSGDAYLCQYSVRKHLDKVYQRLGYCPQFDAVIEQLTGRETIRMFASLKGIRESHIDKIVDNLAENLLFTQHIDKQVGEYSGGNKRKLSTALAMLGNPAIVFLDEPTTGMDPVARRHVWNAVSRLRELGTSVMITSHSMEECEALCSRLAIMVNGRFQCLGSPQHLKNKFGEGYTIVAQLNYSGRADLGSIGSDEQFLKPWERELKPLQDYIESQFSQCELKDVHPGFVQYHILGNDVKWARLFAVMENAKEEFNLEAYSVGQTSLEQVFFNFTKLQTLQDD